MDALIKGNDLNKLKERVMLNKLNEGEWLKQTKGKGCPTENHGRRGFSTGTKGKHALTLCHKQIQGHWMSLKNSKKVDAL